MTTAQGARERARNEVTAAIKEAARRQLAAEGAAKLSLRAVARELGMVSSALYRYFPSRDELLTALIIDAYDALGAAAEKARHAAGEAAPVDCFIAVCEAVRTWALTHPHEYALIYGSPVPGYAAPETTVPAAARTGVVLIGVFRDARQGPGLDELPLSAELRPEAARLAAEIAPDLPPEVAAAMVAAWAQLFGLVSFELFGQFNNVIEDRERFFRHAVTGLARGAGLR